MLTTILIITYKNDKIIFKLLNKFANNYKVIVVENSNNKDFKKRLERKYKNVSCLLTQSNLGFSKACNIGLKKIKTKYTLLINSDIEINYFKIKKLEKIANEINNFSIISPNTPHTKNYILADHDKFHINRFKKKINNTNIVETDKLPGCCFFLNMKDIVKVKYFDENFFFYFEDLDLCKRLNKLNKKIYLIKNFFVKHNANPNDTIPMREWHYYWGMFYYHKKHYGYLRTFILLSKKIMRFFILKNFNFFLNKNKYLIYNARFNGLLNQFLNKKSTAYKKFYKTNKALIDNWNAK